MRIGLDLRMVAGGSGIARYISELSHAILSSDKANDYVLFFKSEADTESYKQYGKKMVVTGIEHYSFAEQIVLPRILKRENLDLVHFPHFNVPIFYNKRFIVTIHDLTHSKFPGRKKSRIFHRVAYNAVLAAAIRKSLGIIAVSESTKREILELFGVDALKVHVVYEGIDKVYSMVHRDEALAQVTNRFQITKPYILYVGVMRRYKNLPKLAQAFSMLRDAGLDYDLVIAGDEDPHYPEIKARILASKHAPSIKLLGRVSDEDLKNLYNAASLFVLPSLAEGFGLTALEAAACGTPIACSDIPTLREVMGQGAEYFDAENEQNMKDVMMNIIKNPNRAEELANLALKRASFFSWAKAAEQTVNYYMEANS